jgi:tryptophanyl-tRNA synthetase
MAQFRWNQLYDSKEHLRLSRAIARELKMQYNDYKLKKSLKIKQITVMFYK